MRIALRKKLIPISEKYSYQRNRYNRILESIIDIDDIKDGGFAKHNPKISEYSLLNSENLIQSLIFCVASQGVSWNVVASLYRVMYQKLLRDGTLNIPNEDRYSKDTDWVDIIGGLGGAKIFAINKLWNNRDEIFITTKRILEKWKYPSPKNLEKQENIVKEYQEKLENAKNKEESDRIKKEYKLKIKSIDDSKDAVIKLFDYYITLPQLGLAKAGFAVQLITGALGCFDSVNQKIYSNVVIPPKIKDTLITYDKAKGKEVFKKVNDTLSLETRVERLKAYADFLDIIAKTVTSSASKRLWDIWVTIVADRLRNTFTSGGKDKENPDNKTILKRGDEILTSADSYNRYPKNPHITKWEDENLEKMNPRMLSAQHHPRYLVYGEYDIKNPKDIM